MSEQLARQFHDTYERLSPSFGYETRSDTKVFDPESKNGRLMIAVCGEVAGSLAAQNAKLREELDEIISMRDAAEAHVIRLREENAKLREACDLYKQASMQSHSGHFDMTMQHGAGCPECIRARELRENAQAVLKEQPSDT